MAGWNGSGVFERAYDWTDDAASDIDITASRFDEENEAFAAGIQNCLTLDGQNSPTADIDFGGFSITNAGAASTRGEYVTAGQLQDGSIIWCGTSGGTANAQTLTPSPAITAYVAGQLFRFIGGNSSTSSCTIDVSGVGAKTVKTSQGDATTGNDILSGAVHDVVYDGTDFRLVNQHAGQLNMRDSQLRRPILRDYGELTTSPAVTTNTLTLDITNSNHFLVTLDDDVTTLTISSPSNAPYLCPVLLFLTQDGTGGHTVTFPSSVKGEDGSTFSYTGTAADSVTLICLFTYDAGTTWIAKVGGQWLL